MSLPTIPVIMTFPSIAIADGVLVLVTGLLALVIGIVGLRSMVLPFCALSAFAYTVQLALFAITQANTLPTLGMRTHGLPGSPGSAEISQHEQHEQHEHMLMSQHFQCHGSRRAMDCAHNLSLHGR